MYPEDVKREEGHPAPFPEKLPARLMRLYTQGAVGEFSGEIVLDPFVGTGTTCVVAERMGRRWIGIDISERYLDYARRRIGRAAPIRSEEHTSERQSLMPTSSAIFCLKNKITYTTYSQY